MRARLVLVRSSFPLLEGGNAVRFCHFVFLGPGSVSFVVFFRSSFLRDVVAEIFGSELLFSGIGVGHVCFGTVLPMFVFYYLAFRSRKGPAKILFWVRSVFLDKFSGANFCLTQ